MFLSPVGASGSSPGRAHRAEPWGDLQTGTSPEAIEATRSEPRAPARVERYRDAGGLRVGAAWAPQRSTQVDAWHHLPATSAHNPYDAHLPEAVRHAVADYAAAKRTVHTLAATSEVLLRTPPPDAVGTTATPAP